MAAGDSPTSICNLGLAMLGDYKIASVSPPDNSKPARLCAQFYDVSRRAMLEAHPWRCAKRQVQPAAASAVPLFTYGQAFPVPQDYIRLFELPEDGTARWEEMNLKDIGLCVATNVGAPLDLVYIFDLTDTTQMAPLLVKTIAAELAVNLALPLTRDATLKAQCEADRQGYLAAARTASAQQGSPRQFDSDRMLRARW